MSEILADVFALRMNINAVTSLRTGAFNTGTTMSIVSSTNATPIVVTVADTTALGAASDTVEVFIAGHLVNTRGNGIYTITVIDGTTFSIPVAGNGVGAGTGTVYLNIDRWVPCY